MTIVIEISWLRDVPLRLKGPVKYGGHRSLTLKSLKVWWRDYKDATESPNTIFWSFSPLYYMLKTRSCAT